MAKKRTFLQDQRRKFGAGKRGWAYFAWTGSQSQSMHNACHFAPLWIQPLNKLINQLLWNSWGIFYPEKCMK